MSFDEPDKELPVPDEPFSFHRVLEVLAEHQVDYVLIGGLAALVLGSPVVTQDLDVCYARAAGNLDRLAAALQALHAHLRGAQPDLPFQLDGRTLALGDSFTFETDFGPFDILATPSGTRGYEQLVANATTVDFDGLSVQVAHVDDLIRMKRAAGRPKDLAALPHLQALRDELDAG